MKDYKVCASDRIKNLEASVTDLLNKGYELHGSMIIDRFISHVDEDGFEIGQVMFWQPMIKTS